MQLLSLFTQVERRVSHKHGTYQPVLAPVVLPGPAGLHTASHAHSSLMHFHTSLLCCSHSC